MNRIDILNSVLNGLMTRYKERVPDVGGIIAAMQQEGVIQDADDIENDHIAFRTMGVPQLGIKSFEKIFTYYGYTKRDYYNFPAKKLDAYWYAPPTEKHPRIFVSELRVQDLSREAQEIILSYTNEVASDPVDKLNLNNAEEVDTFLHSPLWRIPSIEDYNKLAEESEYAAWVIYNRYYLNHFTISIHNLRQDYNSIEDFNEFLERHGFKLNTSGGKVKKSPDGGLLQSATVAEMIEATFEAGEKQLISGSYVEFAERRVLPEYADLPPDQIKRQHRRDGFEANNADKIFESTYSSQTRAKD